jgi:hypothetical protein
MAARFSDPTCNSATQQHIDAKVAAIRQLFRWPGGHAPAVRVQYIYDTPEAMNIAFTEFLIDIGFTPQGALKLRAHDYKITLNCAELGHYPDSVQDFVIAHELAHVQQLQDSSFIFIAHKLMYTPFMMHIGLILTGAVLLDFAYASVLWYSWLLSIVVSNALSRMYELDADKRAACALGQSIGGQLFLQAYSIEPQTVIQRLGYAVFYLVFSTHPAPYRRITYLRNITCP